MSFDFFGLIANDAHETGLGNHGCVRTIVIIVLVILGRDSRDALGTQVNRQELFVLTLALVGMPGSEFGGELVGGEFELTFWTLAAKLIV